MIPAMVEQIIYHGFATHLHLRLPNGKPLVAVTQNRPSSTQLSVRPGMLVHARSNIESVQLVRDELD
jgi:hypothetical protein